MDWYFMPTYWGILSKIYISIYLSCDGTKNILGSGFSKNLIFMIKYGYYESYIK